LSFRLGINTGFAVNRFSEADEWARIVGEDLGIRAVQITADLINPDLPAGILNAEIKRIRSALDKYQVQVCSVFTGAFTRVNHLAHPDPDIRKHWVNWFKRLTDISLDLGCDNIGSHFGIFTEKDDRDPRRREERRGQNIAGWHEIAAYGQSKGLRNILWEPMSISREQGETIKEARKLQDDVNKNAPLPFKICLDVDHGDVSSENPDDTNAYKWLEAFATESPFIHLKQSSKDKSGHWPFIKKYNDSGVIIPEKVISTLISCGVHQGWFLLELSFREREPTDSTVVEVLKESVDYWRPQVRQ